ncbi:hypothetical protein [Streptomyces sampsonii]|uniref:hypothetical protein n=1 Tax=Streptomyces sampsonii TaxID=42239 RepID=UPI0039080C15
MSRTSTGQARTAAAPSVALLASASADSAECSRSVVRLSRLSRSASSSARRRALV